MLLMAIGVVCGFVSTACAAKVPGGAPQPVDAAELRAFRGLFEPLADRNFRLYLLGSGALACSAGIGGFIPLFFAIKSGCHRPKSSCCRWPLL